MHFIIANTTDKFLQNRKKDNANELFIRLFSSYETR